MKGHYIARAVTGLIGLGLIGYAGWLLIQKIVVTTDALAMYSVFALVVVVLFGAYLIVLVANPLFVPSNRRGIALLGLIVLIVAHMLFQDNPEQHVYLRDILKVVAVFLIITGPMKLLLTKKAEQKKYMEEVEIIEV